MARTRPSTASKQLLAVALALVTALGALNVRPLTTRAQTEPDTDTDAYDQTTCADVQEDDVDDVSHTAVQDPYGKTDLSGGSSQDLGNDSEEYSPFPKNNFWPTFESGGDDDTVSFAPSYTEKDDALANQAFVPEPELTFSQSGDAVPGREATVVINARGFSGHEVPGQNLYFGVWLDGKYFNGLLAGGDEDAYDEQSVGAADPARPDCGPIGRSTRSDGDGDGMDDAWELRYGLNPGDPGDAGQDPDEDGYVADAFPNRAGELLSPVPAVAGAELGDGSFSNYEEYVLGTNPRSPDTDGDGFIDEQDAVGLGQNVVTFQARKAPEDGSYILHAIVTGMLEKRDEERTRLAKIDSNVYELLQHSDQDLEVDLHVVNPGVRAGETLGVEALARGSSTPDLLATYRWFVDGLLQTALSGQGKRTLLYVVPDGTRPGTQFSISVEVIDPQNGQLARGRAAITVGDTVLLAFDPEAVQVGATVPVTAQLSAGLDPAEYLFVWSVDLDELTEQSRVGANVLEWEPQAAGGGEELIGVRVLDRGSKEVGRLAQTIRVQVPEVSLVLSPAAPLENQVVTVRAATRYFGSATLEYDFTVDGQARSEATPTVQLNSGTNGSSHAISVVVRTVGAAPASASDSVDFVTGSANAAAFTGQGRSPLLAAVVASQQGAGYVALSSVVAVGLAAVVAARTRRSWRSA